MGEIHGDQSHGRICKKSPTEETHMVNLMTLVTWEKQLCSGRFLFGESTTVPWFLWDKILNGFGHYNLPIGFITWHQKKTFNWISLKVGIQQSWGWDILMEEILPTSWGM